MEQRLTDEQLDALIRQVFGEPEANDWQTLQSVTPEAMSADQDLLVGMRGTLKALSDVPECQLDFARVRRAMDAPKKSRSPIAWLGFAIPVAACAALAVWLISRPDPKVYTPQMVSGKNSRALVVQDFGVPTRTIEQTDQKAQLDPDVQEREVPTQVAESAKPAPAENVAEPRPGLRKHSAPRPAYAKSTPSLTDSALAQIASTAVGALLGGSSAAGSTPRESSRETRLATDSAPNAMAPSDSRDTDHAAATIVVVSSGPSYDARANSAMEVDKRDVVFGG